MWNFPGQSQLKFRSPIFASPPSHREGGISLSLSKEEMASPALDSWARDFGEATRLADEVAAMVAEKGSSSSSSSSGGANSDARRHAPALRRKITILGARLDGLDSLLSDISSRRPPMYEFSPKPIDRVPNCGVAFCFVLLFRIFLLIFKRFGENPQN